MEKVEIMRKKISLIFNSLRLWIKQNPVEFWILTAILVVGSISRLYQINQYMTFLGDEGRDVIIVRRLLTEGHPPLIGPGTSIGNMYLGPLYYYFMAPGLFLTNFSPVGPAVQIALLGIITIWMVWYVGREWFPPSPKASEGQVAWVALIAAGLYAISPIVIIYSRSSWNPNIMPFFAILSVYSIWRVFKHYEFKWMLVLGVAFAFVLQSHYLGLLLAPTIGIFWFLTMVGVWKDKVLKSKAIRHTLYAVVIFALLMSPLLIFDMRHGWINFNAMNKFFSERQTTVSARPWSSLPKLPALFVQINQSLLTGANLTVSKLVSLFIFLGVALMFVKNHTKKGLLSIPAQYYLVFSWIIFALIGFGIYKQNIYDHYFGFVFAVPFLLFAVFINSFMQLNKYTKAVGFLLIGYLVCLSLQGSPLRSTPNNQLSRASHVADKIASEAGANEYNLAVLAERNYQDGYKYFLLNKGSRVVEIDAQRPETIKDQLFVVCEMLPEKCDPVHSPRAEVANFGWSKIESTWEVDGVLVYKLVHLK